MTHGYIEGYTQKEAIVIPAYLGAKALGKGIEHFGSKKTRDRAHTDELIRRLLIGRNQERHDERDMSDVGKTYTAGGALGGAALGGASSLAYDAAKGEDSNYRRALLLSILGGGAGAAAGLGVHQLQNKSAADDKGRAPMPKAPIIPKHPVTPPPPIGKKPAAIPQKAPKTPSISEILRSLQKPVAGIKNSVAGVTQKYPDEMYTTE